MIMVDFNIVDLLDPTVFVMKLPARRPALLPEGSQAINAPPISVGMTNAMIAMPRALNRPAHQVASHTEMNATAQPGSWSKRDWYSLYPKLGQVSMGAGCT